MKKKDFHEPFFKYDQDILVRKLRVDIRLCKCSEPFVPTPKRLYLCPTCFKLNENEKQHQI